MRHGKGCRHGGDSGMAGNVGRQGGRLGEIRHVFSVTFLLFITGSRLGRVNLGLECTMSIENIIPKDNIYHIFSLRWSPNNCQYVYHICMPPPPKVVLEG